MILRRPYAFLIKHFKLIHIIITIILGYIALKNRETYQYLIGLINNTTSRYDVLNYLNYGLYFYMIIVMVLCYLIHWLLKYKDKPRKIYIVTIVGYIIIGLFMLILYSYMREFLNTIYDQKTIRLYRDILTIIMLFQYYIILVMAIRGLGFDIKRFDFKSDVKELNLTEEDSEEVEVNVGIDTTNIRRGIRKSQREFGYFLQEYKLYVTVIVIVILLIIIYKGYNYFNAKYKVYQENELIGYRYNVIVKDSYYQIDEDQNYVIINFDAYKNGVREQLNTSTMTLVIGDKKYTPDKNICYKFKKVGECYKKQYITSTINNYIVSYSVDELNIQNAYLIYNEGYENTYKVKLVMKEY